MYKIEIKVRGPVTGDQVIDLTLRDRLPTAAAAAAKAVDLGFAVAELLGGDPTASDDPHSPTAKAPKAPPKRRQKPQRSKPSSGRRCSLCREPGHRKDLCPENPDRHENRRKLIERAAKARASK